MAKNPKIPPIENEPTVPLKQLRKVVKNLNHLDDSAKINFTFLMTALFPTVWYNIQEYAKRCYTQGYRQAIEENKKNNENN